VALVDAVADAHMLASMHVNAKVMKISGVSMLPFFGEGTLVVVKPIDESKLRAGMVVVYRNQFGEQIAHRLVSRNEQGWTAKGFNNEQVDSTAVNASNLTGVVYATFHTDGIEQAASSVGVEVALAAPAK
jgi:signal peptidase I